MKTAVQIFRELKRCYNSKMTKFCLPEAVRGMKVLDRDMFQQNISVPILKVIEGDMNKIIKCCKPYYMKALNFRPVVDCMDTTNAKKIIYLSSEAVQKWTDIKEDDRNTLKDLGISNVNFDSQSVELTYDNYTHEQIFKGILPENEEIVSGFSQIGHIIHLNLREHLLEYKQVIGQVLIDKIKTCRTVVVKENIIDNTYRNFGMELIAGDNDFAVTVKENNCSFQFDFTKVYWNPRLCKEHERILSLIKPNDVLFDVCCGVGPFSVPAAKRKTQVFANDLNPDCFYWLNLNAKKNHIKESYFKSFNLDGAEFIKTVFKEHLDKYLDGEVKLQPTSKIHITMNLPAKAVEFLKYFVGLLSYREDINKFNLDITIYCYCFANGQSDEEKLTITKELLKTHCSMMLDDVVDIFSVRNVAPKKDMMRVKIKLTKELLFNCTEDEPPSKKICV